MAPRGAARFVVYDLGWPLDVAEYRTLGKHGVLLVSALSQQADELPLKRVYTQADGKVTPLQRLFSTRRAVPAGSLARKVFGPYQEDSFYLVPAGALMQEWLLFCDFAKNRNEFSISRSPMTPPEFIQSDRERHVIAKPIPVALRAFLEREYPGFDHQKWMP
jgi:hypothetical protein